MRLSCFNFFNHVISYARVTMHEVGIMELKELSWLFEDSVNRVFREAQTRTMITSLYTARLQRNNRSRHFRNKRQRC